MKVSTHELTLARQPTACMWCLASGDDVVYDLSHVIPASCGNNELVLPSPIVCKRCNRNFGKIEQAFADEPEFNFKAALLGVPNARTGKPFTHDRFGVAPLLPPRPPGGHRAFEANVNLRLHGGLRIELVPQLVLNGAALPLPTVGVDTTRRWLSFYTRSVQKIMFEWYAHHFYVTGRIPESCGAPTDQRFGDLRTFVKSGQPMVNPRIILRWYENISDAMNFEIDTNSEVLLAEMNLLGTHYVCALAGDNATAEQRLEGLAAQIAAPTMIFTSELRAVGVNGTTVKTNWTFGDAAVTALPEE